MAPGHCCLYPGDTFIPVYLLIWTKCPLNSLNVKDSVSILQIHQPVSLCWDRTDRQADVFGESVTHCLSWKVTPQQHWQWAWVELVRHSSWLYQKWRNTVGLASRTERRDMGYACCLRRACKASGGSFVRILLIYNTARFTGMTAETSRVPRWFSPKHQPQRYQSSDQC